MIRPSNARSVSSVTAPCPGWRRGRRAIHCVLTVGALVVLVPDLVQGAIRVPEDFATLDAAVTAAAANDSILVGPGSYTPNVTVNVPLTILATDGPEVTTLTGENARRPFDSVSAALTLKGFSIEAGGDGSTVVGNEFEGGGLRVPGGETPELLVENCVFRDNRGGRGGALSVAGTATIRNCTFEDNSNGSEYPSVGALGGAVYAAFGATVVIEECTFLRNRSGRGGAVFSYGNIEIRDSTFDDNWSNSTGGGVFVLSNSGDASSLVEGCTFDGNSGGEGGALTMKTTGPKTVRDCVFTGNEGRQVGGALKASNDGVLVVEDCRFIENHSVDQGGGAVHINTVNDGITFSRCYFKGNYVEEALDINAGGGAMWIPENAAGNGVLIEDCTFVENEAVRGAVALIERTGATGPARPVFDRCIFAYNVAQSGSAPIFACGVPGGPAGGTVQCSVIHANLPGNEFCLVEGLDVVVLEETRESRGLALFCDDEHDSLCGDSIAATIACGPVGGLPECGDCLLPTRSVTWGSVKDHFAPLPREEAGATGSTPAASSTK